LEVKLWGISGVSYIKKQIESRFPLASGSRKGNFMQVQVLLSAPKQNGNKSCRSVFYVLKIYQQCWWFKKALAMHRKKHPPLI